MEKIDHFILDLYRAAQNCSLALFSEFVFRELKKHVHFDSAGVADCVIDDTQRISMITVQLHASTFDRFLDRRDIVGAEAHEGNGQVTSRDALMQRAFLNRGKSAIVDITQTFTERSVLDYCRRYETAHALAFIDGNVSDRQFCGVSLWRADKRRPFTEADGETASRLLTHVVLARKVNQRLHAVAGSPSSMPVLCNQDGHLFFISPQAISMLQREWSVWSGPSLPTQLMSALRRSNVEVYHGEAITIRVNKTSAVWNLELSPNSPPAGLTTAEWRVAALAMEGCRYKEIGQRLGISPATVRNQLHAVYGKLNISNKTGISAAVQSLSRADRTNVP